MTNTKPTRYYLTQPAALFDKPAYTKAIVPRKAIDPENELAREK